jgi:hypothetical protein
VASYTCAQTCSSPSESTGRPPSSRHRRERRGRRRSSSQRYSSRSCKTCRERAIGSLRGIPVNISLGSSTGRDGKAAAHLSWSTKALPLLLLPCLLHSDHERQPYSHLDHLALPLRSPYWRSRLDEAEKPTERQARAEDGGRRERESVEPFRSRDRLVSLG